MKLFLVASLISLTSIASADVTIMDNDQTITVDCAKDKQVSIIGNNASVTLTGTCTAVSITGNGATLSGSAKSVAIQGNDNTAKLASVDSIMVAGNDNTVTYKGPATAKKTKVSAPGNNNSIKKQK